MTEIIAIIGAVVAWFAYIMGKRSAENKAKKQHMESVAKKQKVSDYVEKLNSSGVVAEFDSLREKRRGR